MRLPDGTSYPEDYTPEIRRTRAGVTYVVDGVERSLQRLTRADGTTRAVIPYEDHPVTRAFAALAKTLDLKRREHREAYLSWIALAIPMDDHDVISGEKAAKITTAIKEQNNMEDMEKLLARVDRLEEEAVDIRNEVNDEARAAGDAALRASSGVLTLEIQR